MPDFADKLIVDLSGEEPVESTAPLTANEKTERDALAAFHTVREDIETGLRTNQTTVEDKARQALAANATFLALQNPTNAQILAQVRLLTREANGLIRLQLDELADVSDT